MKTHHQEDEVSCKIQQLQALENLGADVLVIRTDKTDAQQIHQSFLSENIKQINGVICSTGIKREKIFGSIPEIDHIESEKLFDFQRRQITVLEQVLQNINLDFCIVFLHYLLF